PDEAAHFRRTFLSYLDRAYRWDLWRAAFLIGGGCSDDSFMDFRSWLISLGRDVYERAISDPDSLPDVVTAPAVAGAFFEAFGPDLSDDSGFPANSDTPAGEPFDEASEQQYQQLLPRLWRLYGGRAR